jgi:hypothetical protein
MLPSGRNIVETLKKNTSKDPEKYDESMPGKILKGGPGYKKIPLIRSTDDIPPMRKVVSYCKRQEKSKLDINSKSYRSLKNRGHDAQKI